jgi:LmbE family N-acetylglucosaminyl deacetylase
MKKNKILIVAAHPDDEILGCGGTISKLKNDNDIQVIFMTNGVSARGKNIDEIKKRRKSCLNLFKYININKPIFFNFPDNKMDTIPLLKIIKKIEIIIKKFKPETIFTHYANCLNIDHRKTFEAVITACRPINKLSVKKILSFEVLSSTEWALFKDKNFQPNYYIDITQHLKQKLEFMHFYSQELKSYPHSRSIKSIKSLSEIRGVSCGVKYAEGFYLHRLLD